MLKLLKKLENINELVARLIDWFTLLIVLVTFLVVILRYGFNFGSIALQESTSYFHAFVFMLGAAYTLKHDGHVRFDILYRIMNKTKKAWVDLLGTLVLWCVFWLVKIWRLS